MAARAASVLLVRLQKLLRFGRLFKCFDRSRDGVLMPVKLIDTVHELLGLLDIWLKLVFVIVELLSLSAHVLRRLGDVSTD